MSSIAILVYFCSCVGLEILFVKPCCDIQLECQEEQERGLAGWQGSQIPMGFLTRADKQCWQTPGPPGETCSLCKAVWVVVCCEKQQLRCACTVCSSLPALSQPLKLSKATQGCKRHRPWRILVKSLPPAESLWTVKKGESVGGPSWCWLGGHLSA